MGRAGELRSGNAGRPVVRVSERHPLGRTPMPRSSGLPVPTAGTSSHDGALSTTPAATSGALGAPGLIAARTADVGRTRERRRRERLLTVALVLALPAAFLWFRLISGDPFNVFALPHIDPLLLFAAIVPIAIVGAVVVPPMAMGRSPHVTYQPEQIDVRLADVVGVEQVKEEVVRSLNLSLAPQPFPSQRGGRPRRGLLFEGAPGTGKTLLAKAMAAEADVPFLFVSATSFQSMFYGATARKIRSYFQVLRRTAEREGGAIGFIEEIDAIAGVRGGMERAGMERAGFTTIAASTAALPTASFCCSGPQVLSAATAPAPGLVVNPNAVS